MRSKNSSRAALTVADWQRGGFGLYVHWPFCEAKCPYCDFNSHVVRQVDQTRWARALAAEITRYGQMTEGRVLTSIFFGGGTPSLMEPATVHAVIEAARQHWTFANDIEITLEANPRSVEAARFEGYARAGVNRVSLGVQSLNADDLKRLGRLHDVTEARAAISLARQVFGRVSFDLIYARQGQSLSAWTDELGEALSMGMDHLSLYQLTIEPGTAFFARHEMGGLRGLPDEDLGADLFETTQKMTAEAGMPAYEVSNHARSGAESRHNLIYWRGGDWVGVGPGAHGRLTLNGQRRGNAGWMAPGKWLDRAEAGNADESSFDLAPLDAGGESLMMGLRLTEGLNLDWLAERYGLRPPENVLRDMLDLDLIWQSERQIGTTLKGRMVLNALIERLLPD